MAATEEISSDFSDFSKMKVADLKKELRSRGLSTSGNKTELIERLQNGNQVYDLLLGEPGAVDDADADAEIDEDAMLEDGLDDEEEDDVSLTPEVEKELEEEPKLTKATPLKRKINVRDKNIENTSVSAKKIVLVRNLATVTTSEKENVQSDVPDKKEEEETESKKVVKLSGLTMKERLELRAQKFGPGTSNLTPKDARALRFGLDTKSTPPVSSDKLKERAERFGGNVSRLALKAQEMDKLKARQERFSLKSDSSLSLDEKKKLRAERFKLK